MAQNGGADFHLPDEILAVIPTDPYEQLDLARKITSMAIASRISKLEAEADRLRQRISERDRVIVDLEDRLAHLDRLLLESDSRLRSILEENAKLSKDRDSLAVTSKKLSRDLTKLETFKRQLMQSLSDDNIAQAEAIDMGTCDQSIHRASSWNDEGSPSHSSSNDAGDLIQEGPSGYKFTLTPYITPRISPTGTPKVSSIGNSPRGSLTAGSSPKIASGTTSPTKSRIEQYSSMSSWYPSSQQSSASSSPPHRRSLPGRAPRIDGKEFFRQARSRLSYEQFGAFLANIKELNAHKLSRESVQETLQKAEEIFGTENKDLYISFQGLLNRSMP